ncbi:Histone-lysine N-methyltransferase SETDB2 [Merluccius polli]|uniref:Histone-lysine N-methyltransferase SETDB2 n=1 Tax=Merluccius polli TaxID=89951 RepID=A0AA47MH89_MERPO|nr:Histone-lysine N-methyltransferase SETDB2 [Merluccius polli]
MGEPHKHPQDVDGARAFWVEADVDAVFNRLCEYLEQLRCTFKSKTATDTDYVQGLKLVKLVEAGLSPEPPDSSSSIHDVIIHDVIITGPELLPVTVSSQEEEQQSAPLSPLLFPSDLLVLPLEPPSARQEEEQGKVPANQEEVLTGLNEQEEVSAGLKEQEEVCAEQEEKEEVSAGLKEQEEVSAEQEEQEEISAGQEEVFPTEALYQPHQCTKACLPSLPRTSQPFWGQNPLKVPLLCGFQRLGGQEVSSVELVYTAPCGLRLHSRDDVMRFLFATESYDVLQVEFFTFNGAVRLDPPLVAGPRLPELDLSRGLEPTPVELCPSEAGTRPRDFRYRKDRWPHGCFLSSSPALFHTCCDCLDGCLDAISCACRGLTSRGQHYTHHTLSSAVESGLFECGPWCGCDRARCQNRLVQQGVRVRLQVFQTTTNRGWGVRCRDDLEKGTFICTYAGLVLRKGCDPEESPPPKFLGAEPPSDDDVEVVTEWLAPPVTEGSLPTSSPPLHVPVIQRPGAGQSTGQEEVVATATVEQSHREPELERRVRKRKREYEDVYYLDATKEGNVARFLNHSCWPNLFTQSVFTDTQDPGFPLVAFFTSRVIKAGTELTWKCSLNTGSASSGQEVACQCGNEDCQEVATFDQAVCEVCDVHEDVSGQEA